MKRRKGFGFILGATLCPEGQSVPHTLPSKTRVKVWHPALFVTGMLLVIAVASPASAVKPGEWIHQTEADFQSSELDHAVVTNLGRVELSRSSEQLAELEAPDTIINDLAMIGDDLYLAVGPEGRLLRWKQGEEDPVTTVAEFEDEQLFALAVQNDALWVAVSGSESRLEKRVGDEVQQTIALPDVRYVWDVAIVGDQLWLATGTDGKVLVIDLDADQPQPAVALDTEQTNVLCLGVDAQNRIYVGTDTEGLIYRITPTPDDAANPYQVFVLYDAAEPEIGALRVEPGGVVYAGTADANEARPGRLAEAMEESPGTPEAPQAEAPDEAPPPPEEPPPTPPQPEPMPSQTEPAGAPPDAAAPAESAESSHPPPPTAQQYDQLRKYVKDRLQQLRADVDSKRMALTPGSGRRLAPRRPSAGSASSPANAQQREGNAIYRIDTDGFVREVFRESVMILSIVEHNGRLLVATGNEGQIYRVDTDGQKFTVLADLDPQQAVAMRVIDDQVVIGTANPALLVRLGGEYAATGDFTADPLDATQISLWGKLSILAMIPDNCGVSVRTRTGNVGDPEAGYWSQWSEPQSIEPEFAGQPVYLDVESVPARFIQYRLTLTSDGSDTPSVAKVTLKYLMPNMAPGVESLTASYPEPSKDDEQTPQTMSTVDLEWTVNDPNGDALTFTLETRRFGAEDQPFIMLADEITENTYEWDTRSIPDGLYEVRLTASDSPDNVPDQVKTARRISAQVVVDNSPPDVADFNVQAAPKSAGVSARALDELSPIREIRYSVDGAEEWKPLLPGDLIYDSTEEQVSFTIPDLSPGAHVVSLRATDTLGNARYVSRAVTVPQ